MIRSRCAGKRGARESGCSPISNVSHSPSHRNRPDRQTRFTRNRRSGRPCRRPASQSAPSPRYPAIRSPRYCWIYPPGQSYSFIRQRIAQKHTKLIKLEYSIESASRRNSATGSSCPPIFSNRPGEAIKIRVTKRQGVLDDCG